MTSSRTLPNPTWHGSPSNLLPRYVAFLRKHKQSSQVTDDNESVADLLASIASYERYLASYEHVFAARQRELARINARITEVRSAISFSDEEYEAAAAALIAHPSVIGSRIDDTGSLVLLVRPRRKDGLDLGDFQIGQDLFKRNGDVLLCRATHWGDITFSNLRYNSRVSEELTIVRYRITANRERLVGNMKRLEVVNMLEYVVRRINRLSSWSYRDFAKLDEEHAQPLWEGHATMPGKALKQLLKLAIASAEKDLIRDLEDQKWRITEDINTYRRAMSEYQLALRDKRAKLARLERAIAQTVVEIDEDEAKRDLELITTELPGVMGIRFDNDGTPVVHIRSSFLYRGHRYDLGDLEFWLKANTGSSRGYGVMKVMMTRQPANGNYSPYLSIYRDVDSNENWFCFGGRSYSMAQILSRGEFGHLLNVTVHSINRMNAGDESYNARRFVEIPLDEVWQNRPRRRRRRRARMASCTV